MPTNNTTTGNNTTYFGPTEYYRRVYPTITTATGAPYRWVYDNPVYFIGPEPPRVTTAFDTKEALFADVIREFREATKREETQIAALESEVDVPQEEVDKAFDALLGGEAVEVHTA